MNRPVMPAAEASAAPAARHTDGSGGTARWTPLAAALLLSGLLAACGGGGGSGGDGDDAAAPAGTASLETAQAASADTTLVSADSSAATAATLSAVESVVGTGQATQTIACPGGGSAVYLVSGAGLATLANGRLDTGEHYTLTLAGCRNASGSASIDGRVALDVVEATSGRLVVTTDSQAVVTLPQATIAFDGSSTVERTTSTVGSTTTTTTHWTSPSIQLVRTRNGTVRAHTLSDLDLTGSFALTGGVMSATSLSGSATFSRNWPNGAYAVTMQVDGSAGYDSDGLPTTGDWTITLPDNRIDLHVADGTATASVDHGADGTVDRTWTWTTAAMADAAL